MFSGLSAEQLSRFDTDGYLVVEDVLSSADLGAIEEEYTEIMACSTANLVQAGLLNPLKSEDFGAQFIESLQQLEDMYDLYQYLDISLPLFDELDESASMNAGRAVFDLLTNQRVLNIVESVIGPEIYSNPVQHTRIKPPKRLLLAKATDANVAATLWHQDGAVVTTSADRTNMLTVWLAITDATVENGCLIAVEGSHRRDSTLHCPGKVFPAGIYIPDSIIDHDRGGRARSKTAPETALTDADEWANLWWDARSRIASSEVEVGFGSRWAATPNIRCVPDLTSPW